MRSALHIFVLKVTDFDPVVGRALASACSPAPELLWMRPRVDLFGKRSLEMKMAQMWRQHSGPRVAGRDMLGCSERKTFL